MSPLLFNLLLLVLTAGACFALFEAVWQSKPAVAKRLRPRVDGRAPATGRFAGIVQQAIERWPASQSSGSLTKRKLANTLNYAGFHGAQASAIFQLTRALLMIGLTLIGIALAASIGKSMLIMGATGCALGYIAPTLTIQRLAIARQRRIKAELPDVLALLVVSLEAGIGFGEVVKLVGREAERQGRVLGQELSATAAQTAAGRSLEDSLRGLAERIGVDEVTSLVALVIQSQKVGARMGPALRASAELLNSQRRLAAEEAAHKIAVKMLIPLVFLILPALLLIIVGPAVIQVLRMFHLGP